MGHVHVRAAWQHNIDVQIHADVHVAFHVALETTNPFLAKQFRKASDHDTCWWANIWHQNKLPNLLLLSQTMMVRQTQQASIDFTSMVDAAKGLRKNQRRRKIWSPQLHH